MTRQSSQPPALDLPPAELLQEYASIDPDAATKILNQCLSDHQHRTEVAEQLARARQRRREVSVLLLAVAAAAHVCALSWWVPAVPPWVVPGIYGTSALAYAALAVLPRR